MIETDRLALRPMNAEDELQYAILREEWEMKMDKKSQPPVMRTGG